MNKVWSARYFLLFALMVIFPASALAFTCVSTGGNWATAATWTSCNGTIPQAGDTVVINSGSVVLNTSATISGLTMNGGTLVFGNNNTVRTLTVNGNIVVAAGATMNVANNNATHVLNISGNLTNNGTFDLYRDNNSLCTANFTGVVTHTIDGSSAGTTEFYNVTVTPVTGNLTINKTGAAVTQTGTLSIGGNLAVQAGTYNLANTVTVTGTTSISGTLGVISTTGTKTFTGLVTVNAGGIWSNTANEAVTFRGGITNNGTFVGGAGTQTFDTNNQSIGGTSPINFGGIVAVMGARTITNNNTSAVTIAGNLTGQVAGSTWVNAANSTLNYGGAAAPMGTRVFNVSAVPNTVNYNGTVNQAVRTANYNNLIVNKTAGTATTGTGTLNVSGSLNVIAGRLNIANTTMTVTGSTNVSGTLGFTSTTGTKTFTGLVTVNAGGIWSNTANEAVTFRGGITNNGTFTGGTGTQTFDTNNQAIGGSSAINFGGIVAVVGARTITNNNTSAVTIAGNLTGSVAGSTWVNAANSTLNYGGAAAPMGTGVFSVSAAPNTVNYNRAGNQTVKLPAGNAYHHLTLSGSGVKTLPATAMTIAGDFTISGTATATAAANLSVGGNWTETGTFNPGTSTVTLNGTAAQTISGTSPVNFNNLTVTNATSPNITLATNVLVTGTLTGTVTLTSTCPIDYTFTYNGGATILHSCPPVTPPANFICIEAGATYIPNPVAPVRNPLYTKLAGTAFSFDVIALKADGTVETSYASASNKNVTVELVDGSGTTACASRTVLSPAVSQIVTFAASNAGRKAVSITVSKAYADLRCRVTDANQAPSIVGCSTDNFAVRPARFTVTSTDATNTGATGTPVIKAGANFNLTATAVAGYGATPSLDAAQVVGSTMAGALGGSFGAADSLTGVATGSAFSYGEVGNFGLNANAVFDANFTGIDNAVGDCTDSFSNTLAGGQYGCKIGSTVVALSAGVSGFGRFIPDHFDTVVTGPMTCPSVLTCPAGGLVYSRQAFSTQVIAMNGLATPTKTINYNNTNGYSKAVTLSAWSAAGGSTTNPGGGALTLNTVAATAFTGGVATTATPIYELGTVLTAPTDIFVRATEDAGGDGVTSLRSTPAASVEGGVKVVNGRIKMSNAYGSALLPLKLLATAQFYNATGSWVTSDTDTVTTITATDFALAFPVVAANKLVACETALSITGSSPVFNVNLSTPGAGNNGWTDLTLNLGVVAAGNRCTAVGGAGAASTTANRPWLQYPIGTNPVGRATFGVYSSTTPFIYQREAY